MTDTSRWHMSLETDANQDSPLEPRWISELRARCLATMRDYRGVDEVMRLVLAPAVLDELAAAGSAAVGEADQYWPSRDISPEDLQAAAEMERRAGALFTPADARSARDFLVSWRWR